MIRARRLELMRALQQGAPVQCTPEVRHSTQRANLLIALQTSRLAQAVLPATHQQDIAPRIRLDEAHNRDYQTVQA